MSNHNHYYEVWVDCGGMSELVQAFTEKEDGISYVKGLCERIYNMLDKALFLEINSRSDGFFEFRIKDITGVRLVPGFTPPDDDDDDDNDDSEDSPITPMTHDEFERSFG